MIIILFSDQSTSPVSVVSPPGRSSVIVGRSQVTPVTPIVPKPVSSVSTVSAMSGVSALVSAPGQSPAVQIINNTGTVRQPQVIRAQLVVENTPSPPVIYAKKAPSRPIVVAPVSNKEEPAQRYIFEPDQMKLTPLKGGINVGEM